MAGASPQACIFQGAKVSASSDIIIDSSETKFQVHPYVYYGISIMERSGRVHPKAIISQLCEPPLFWSKPARNFIPAVLYSRCSTLDLQQHNTQYLGPKRVKWLRNCHCCDESSVPLIRESSSGSLCMIRIELTATLTQTLSLSQSDQHNQPLVRLSHFISHVFL